MKAYNVTIDNQNESSGLWVTHYLLPNTMRRTNAQISHDNYCSDVDDYKYFILDTEQNRITCGYEYKEDAQQEQIDNDMEDYTRVIGKLVAGKLFDLPAILASWKGQRP